MISFPKYIQIETSLMCNGRCNFCPHKDMKRSPVNMEDWVWKKIIDESRGKDVIYRPFLINEPFMDKRMPDIISYIKQDKGAKVEFNSNGNFAKATNIKALLKAGIDVVRFSIDGFTKETYDKSGRNGNFETIVNNVKEFISMRNELNSSCLIEVRMIDMDFNRKEHKDFVNFWSSRADRAIITASYDWPWSGQDKPFKAPCPKIREEMFFMTNGEAILCCWDAHSRTIIGDVKTNTVSEIWNSKKLKNIKKLLNEGEREKILICSKCDAFKSYDFSGWEGY